MRTILLLLCLATLPAADMPDVFPVATTAFNVYIEGAGRWARVVKRTVTHDIVRWPKADWLKVYGPFTAADFAEYERSGQLSRAIVLNHYTL